MPKHNSTYGGNTIRPVDLFQYTPCEKVVFLSGAVIKRQHAIQQAVLAKDWPAALKLIEAQIKALNAARQVASMVH